MRTEHIEALKLALKGAANYIDALGGDSRKYRQELAEQPAQQEPVSFEAFNAWMHHNLPVGTVIGHSGWWADKIYSRFIKHTSPPAQRTWVGLTDEEKRQIFEREDYQGWLDYINAIEAKLKEKNT